VANNKPQQKASDTSRFER